MLIKMLREVADNMEYNFPEVKKDNTFIEKKGTKGVIQKY